MVSISEDDHFIVKSEAKKFDKTEDVQKAFEAVRGSPINLSTVTKITLGGNSYGFEACEWVANLLET